PGALRSVCVVPSASTALLVQDVTSGRCVIECANRRLRRHQAIVELGRGEDEPCACGPAGNLAVRLVSVPTTLSETSSAVSSRRPGLDGIRALAFLSVLLAHVRVPHLLGGGLGVEVFFVLSGCLITGLLLSERERTGRINIGAFYVRRGRRLLPALVVVLVV